jgi:hypothetical protein
MEWSKTDNRESIAEKFPRIREVHLFLFTPLP